MVPANDGESEEAQEHANSSSLALYAWALSVGLPGASYGGDGRPLRSISADREWRTAVRRAEWWREVSRRSREPRQRFRRQ